MPQFFHSVTLDEEKCKGCTNCIKRCPTEAIRVRGGKARIISERCIDCGECIRVCPHRAKLAKSDRLEEIRKFSYKIAIPAPALYGQFNNLDDIDYVLTGLVSIGFNDVFEVSRAAELVSDATRKMIDKGQLKTPVISSACPAVVRLIRVKFPDLCSHVLPLKSPMETAAVLAKQEAAEKTGLPMEDIGVFFITPCPAKVTDLRAPIGVEESHVDGAVSINEVYPRLLEVMDRKKPPMQLARSGIIGVSWASSGGEASALIKEKYLAADGIENVIAILEELEDERLNELDFIELNACRSGCVGGVLAVENPYVAKARIQSLRKYLPVAMNHLEQPEVPDFIRWEKELEFLEVMKLSDDLETALVMRQEIENLCARLPDLDCGSCGAPSCRALAEDIVRGGAQINDCVFILREGLKSIGLLHNEQHRTEESR